MGQAAHPTDIPATRSIDARAGLYRRVAWRVLPILFAGYFVSYLDRVNVGFAQLQMASRLGISPAQYGFAAGVFFLGYVLFEVPSNLVLHRVGARRWLARIMLSWGAVSVLTAWTTSARMFEVMRFLLGVAEAGFFPGIIFYLATWFPAARRGRMLALFAAAVPISGVIGNPLSGWILAATDGSLRFAGWQWLFIIEGLPAIVVGVALLRLLPDRPADARWLSAGERALLAHDLEVESRQHAVRGAWRGLSDGRVWFSALIYFGFVMGLYGVGFWLPTIVRHAGFRSATSIGLVSAIPFACGALAMLAVGYLNDRTQRRRFWFVLPAVVCSVGLAGAALFAQRPLPAIAFLTLATMGTMAQLAAFWPLPTAFLGGVAAAGGIAVINSIGNLAGFLAPYGVGLVTEATGHVSPALLALAAIVLVLGVAALALPKDVDR
jgi:sugar phosphate permease